MTGKKIDTGTGGIRIPDDKGIDKVYTYDVGVDRQGEAQQGVVPADYGNWNSGDINVDKVNRDLAAGTKRTLAQYLSNTTLGKTNSVPIQADTRANRYQSDPKADGSYIDFKLTENGLPKGPQKISENETNAFQPDLDKGGIVASYESKNASLQSTAKARSTWFSAVAGGTTSGENQISPVSRGMIRNKANEETTNKAIDGNDLLRVPLDEGTKQIKPDHPIASYSNALIKNRWSSENRFNIPEQSQSDIFRFRPLAAIDYKLGESYSPEEYNKPEVTTVSQAQLAAVGNVLMARASSELFGQSEGLDPANAGFQAAAALIPGGNQLGVYKVPELVMQAKDVLLNMDLTETDGDEKSPGIDAANITSIAPAIQNSLDFNAPLASYGALNNPFDPYTGLGAIGMQILAIAFVVAITIIPAALKPSGADLKDTSKNPTADEKDVYGRSPIGRYKQRGRSTASLTATTMIAGLATGEITWTDLLGFGPTIYPLGTCIDIGILTFFGLNSSDSEGRDVQGIDALAGVVALSGAEAYIVFSRSIFRSFMQLTEEIVKIGRAFANPAAGIQQLLNFVDFFRNSKLIRALNTFAQLGDQTLRDDSKNLDRNAKGFGKKKSEIDKRTIAGDAAYRKSRLITLTESPPGVNTPPGHHEKSLRHAWSSFRSPDMLMLPKSLHAASIVDSALGSPQILPAIDADDNVGTRNEKALKLKKGVYYTPEEGNRIKTEDRKKFEEILDAEYMPFYFHDVRTNEIVSFHAFLTSLGDSYTASYDSTDAFGRVEPIKSYKSTTRKIDVGFQIAALSPEDFDYMWLKINKLTSLVYPQFTQGKIADTQNYKVTVPFSQQIAAAPLVRLRVGDLVQSNYSRFNLARLFGYTYGQDAYYSSNQGPKGADGSKLDLNNVPTSEQIKKAVNESKVVGNTFITRSKLIFEGADADQSGLNANVGTPRYVCLRITEIKGDVATCKVTYDPSIKDQHPDEEARAKKKKEIDQEYGPDSKLPIIDKTCKVALGALEPTFETQKTIYGDKAGFQAFATYQAAVEDFMRPEANAVVKSFESSGGRGLAGFIESLSFDWYSGTVWEETIERGGRAPKMCKVTMSFTPFHDITPGLDHMGANRAPIYPIGPHRPRVRS